jgi:shikimate dehydrogenase
VWALREAGAEVRVWNRTPERARALAEELGVGVAELPWAPEVLVNATSVGLGGGRGELPLSGMSPAIVVDLVYGPEPTALCRWAERAGARVVDGLEVLVRQGARSFERWTGRGAPIELMRDAARSGVARISVQP